MKKVEKKMPLHIQLNKVENKRLEKALKKTSHRFKAPFVREAIKEKCEALGIK